MLIAFHGIDHPDASELRVSLRPAHLEFHARRGNLIGGPLLDADDNMCGSLIVFEATDVAEASTEMAADPYVVGGLFKTIAITQFIAADWPTPRAT